MNDEIKKYLSDILTAISSIEFHLSGKRDFILYQKSLTVKRAVEREIEIIGEATSRIFKADSKFDLKNGKAIISMRNRVIHNYDSVDDNLIWKIIIKDLPVLKEEVENLLLKY